MDQVLVSDFEIKLILILELYRCKCSDEQECVYDKTDLKMRVYRQICVSQNEETSEENTTEEEEQNKDHQHLLATRSRRALMFLNKFKF